MSLLLLVRHGETTWNAEHRLQGQADLELSDRGHEQVLALAPAVAAHRPTGVTVSPLRRTLATAALLGLDPALPVRHDARWQEADLGEWTGRTREDLVAAGDGRYAAWRAGAYTPPGAELLADVRERVVQAVADVARLGGVQLVVTHGGPVRAVCSALVGLEAAAMVPVAPASLTVVDLSGPRPRLQVLNLACAPGPTAAPTSAAGRRADPPD